MSTVFSRRAFLKYTAVAAVAVAGTSLLGGCSGSGAETAIQTTYPSDNVVLKVKSTLESLEYSPNPATRPLRSISSTAARIPSS